MSEGKNAEKHLLKQCRNTICPAGSAQAALLKRYFSEK